MEKWQRYKYLPVLPLGENNSLITGSKKHTELSRKAATEGMVLLKNDNSVLPIKNGTKVALFGKASVDYVKGGGGSGDVTTAYVHNLCDGMEEKQSEGKIEVFESLNGFYRENVKKQYGENIAPGKTTEPKIPKELLKEAADTCDLAVISICRYSNEGADRTEENDFYLTAEEKNMIDAVTEKFENTVVVLNVGGMVDTSWFINNTKIPAVLLAWQGGMEGGKAEADILCGDACPSGRLTDTFASSFADYPSSYNFHESENYVEYTDDIFVGYRYFFTIPGTVEKVNYPFGFGLSYTSFKVETQRVDLTEDILSLTVKVTNIGKMAGKQVIQIYSASPVGLLDKPAFELRDFGKTRNLAPNQSQEMNFKIDIKEFASYSEEKAAYILEKGTYGIYVGISALEKEEVFTFELANSRITQSLTNLCVPKKLSRRLKSDGNFETLETTEYEKVYDTSDWPTKPTWKFEHIQPDFRDTVIPKERKLLESVVDGEVTLNEFIAQLSIEDLVDIVGGRPNQGVANTWGIGDLYPFGIPAVMTADGPAGLRIKPEVGVCTTAWPCATLLACTWDTETVCEVGAAAALEVKENNIGMWLTPALNIHRSPLCGRNFEYYSEDPVVSGKIASALVKGIQSQGVSSCVKHFCCNNKETNRFASDSRVSERALREIYLKGFKIVVEKAKPWAIMTSYNILNGTYTSENRELIKGILRDEWGYNGLVVSDWGNWAEHYRELKAGNNLRMPSSGGKRLLKALELGLTEREELEENAKYILEWIIKMA